MFSPRVDAAISIFFVIVLFTAIWYDNKRYCDELCHPHAVSQVGGKYCVCIAADGVTIAKKVIR